MSLQPTRTPNVAINGEQNWWRLGNLDSGEDGELSSLRNSTPALIELDDGRFLATTALPDFIASIIVDERGSRAVVYRRSYSPAGSELRAESAICSLKEGQLSAEAAADLAVDLRHGKHADPILGAASAYIYDSTLLYLTTPHVTPDSVS